MRFTFGWFTTGKDLDALNLLTDILDGIKGGKIHGELSYIFLNRGYGEGYFSDRIIEMSRSLAIPLISLSSAKFEPELRKKQSMGQWREVYHAHALGILKEYDVKFSVLAGYMLIVGKNMCSQLNLINLHPAKPNGPAGTWQEVIWHLIKDRATESGVMIHKVTPELDKGPPITYCLYNIMEDGMDGLWAELERKLAYMSLQDIIKNDGEENHLFQAIRKKGIERERPLLFETIKELCTGKLEIRGNIVYYKGNPIKGGVSMTDRIEALIK